MKILYCRVSTLDQKTDRQRVNALGYNRIVEDTCSGKVPFFDRDGGKTIQNLATKGQLKKLAVWTIDRLGRDLRDILDTIHYFNQKSIPIHFVSQNLTTIDEAGKENPISRLIISILGIVGEMERNMIRERQSQGIEAAKRKGVYQGRISGTKEDLQKFLSKEKNKKALTYLKKGYKATEVSKIVGIHINTITKIKRLGIPQDAS